MRSVQGSMSKLEALHMRSQQRTPSSARGSSVVRKASRGAGNAFPSALGLRRAADETDAEWATRLEGACALDKQGVEGLLTSKSGEMRECFYSSRG